MWVRVGGYGYGCEGKERGGGGGERRDMYWLGDAASFEEGGRGGAGGSLPLAFSFPPPCA